MPRNLFSDQGSDVGFERSCAETHNDDGNDEKPNDTVLVDDTGDGANDQKDVTEQDDDVGDLNSLVSTEVLIGDEGTEQRCEVDPEGVERRQTESGLEREMSALRWARLRSELTFWPIPSAPGWPSVPAEPVLDPGGRGRWIKFCKTSS